MLQHLFNRLNDGMPDRLTQNLVVLRPIVSQSVLRGVRNPMTNFSIFFFNYHLDSCRIIDDGLPLWRVSGDSWPDFTVSNMRLPQPGGPGSCIYFFQEQLSPVMLPSRPLSLSNLHDISIVLYIQYTYKTSFSAGAVQRIMLSQE
jgi:hypothetical protein